MSLVDRYANELAGRLRAGSSLADAMRDLTLEHAAYLQDLGSVRVLALDPCPRCGGRVIAAETEAKCAAGCGWSYRRDAA